MPSAAMAEKFNSRRVEPARELERFPKRLNWGFPHGGEFDSSFLLEEASMDGEAVFGGLANARSRGD